MEWKEYPAGAELHLFDNQIHIYVIKNGRYWEATTIPGAPVYGAIILARGVTKSRVMGEVEKWAKKKAEELLQA